MGELEPRLIFFGSVVHLRHYLLSHLKSCAEQANLMANTSRKRLNFYQTFLTKITRSFYINPNCGGVFFFLGGGRFAKLFLLDMDG